MVEERELEKQLKLATKTGKFVVGRKEVMGGLKGSKLLVWSASANLPQKLLEESRSLGIPSVMFAGNPVELGRTCGIPFRVSVIAIKAAGDADLKSFSSSADYTSTVTGTPMPILIQQEIEPVEHNVSVQVKEKRASKRKKEEKKSKEPEEEKKKEAPARTPKTKKVKDTEVKEGEATPEKKKISKRTTKKSKKDES